MKSYFKCLWNHAESEYPAIIWYEVTVQGSVIRSAEYFANGKKHWDDLMVYRDNGIEPLGRDSLTEGNFLTA